MRHLKSRLIATIFLFVATVFVSNLSAAEPDEVPGIDGYTVSSVGIVIGCAIVGAPTCIYLAHQGDGDFRAERNGTPLEFQIGFFPSYVLDLAESVAFQRVEGSVLKNNTLFGLSHRRGVQEPNVFSSTSYRVAYSFEWRHLRPAFGFGIRRNVNARNGDALEIWLPLFANRTDLFPDSFSIFLETLWVFGADGIRPEVQARFEFGITKYASFGVSLGYFPDYHNPETELSVGPIAFF